MSRAGIGRMIGSEADEANMKRYGTMLENIKLAGTDLELRAGDRVHLTPANNLPIEEGYTYFARPPYGKWRNGYTLALDTSIAITATEVRPD